MKSTLNKIALILKMIYRNIINNPFKTIIMIIGMTGVALTILMSFSVKPFLQTYEYHRQYEKYGDIDITLSTGPNSEARFFSITPLKQSSINDDEDVYYLPFFEFDVLIANTETFVHVYASENEYLLSMFSKLEALKSDEIIITKSLATNLDKNTGDIIEIQIGDKCLSYNIKYIVVDNNLLSSNSVYIDKTTTLKNFLEILEPSLSDLPNALLTNIYNRVYFQTNDDNIDFLTNQLNDISQYDKLTITKSVDIAKINQTLNTNFPIFFVVIFGLGLLMLIVFQTTLNLYFEDKTTSFKIFNSLGAKKSFTLLYIIIEMLLLIIISFFMALLLGNIIFNYSNHIIANDFSYNISSNHKVITLIILILVFIAIYIFYDLKYFRLNNISNKPTYKNKISIYKLITLVIALLSYFILHVNNDLKFTLARVVLILIISAILIELLYIVLSWFINKYFYKRLINLKFKITVLNSQYLKFNFIFIITIISTIFIIGTQVTINEYIENHPSFYKIDYALSNHYQKSSDFIEEVSNIDGINNVLSVNIYQDNHFYVDKHLNTIEYLIYNNNSKIEDFIDIDISSNILNKLSTNEFNYLIIHDSYRKMYDLDDGSLIEVYLSGDNVVEFVIAGFYEGDSKHVGLTNFKSENDIYETLLIQTDPSDKLNVKSTLINEYGKDMIVITDYKEVIKNSIKDLSFIVELLSYILVVVFSCFILTLLNNISLLFKKIRTDDEKLYILGVNQKTINIQFHLTTLFTSIITILLSLLLVYVLKIELENVILLFKQYQAITNNNIIYIAGVIFGIIIIVIINLFHLVYMSNNKVGKKT